MWVSFRKANIFKPHKPESKKPKKGGRGQKVQTEEKKKKKHPTKKRMGNLVITKQIEIGGENERK